MPEGGRVNILRKLFLQQTTVTPRQTTDPENETIVVMAAEILRAAERIK